MADGPVDEPIYDKFVRANARHLNDPLIAAFEVALRLGQWVVGPEHVFSALLAGKPDPQAAEVMAHFGVDADAFEAELRRRATNRPSERVRDEISREQDRITSQGWSIRSNPAYSRIDGLARGFSASRHAGPTQSLDYLLAFLWSGPHTLWPFALRTLGVTPETVVDELADRGVALPPDPLPETNLGIQIVKISAESVPSAIAVLGRQYPDETDRGWRIEVRPKHAVVFADPRIDLQAALTEAGADQVEELT